MKRDMSTDAAGSADPPGDKVTRTTCPYCGVGCGILARTGADGSVRIEGDPEHPANFGRLCAKGSALAETLSLDDRLLTPMIGDRATDWDEALDLTARKFRDAIDEHGPDSVAFYVSGQLLTEDYYVANKLMKGFIGSANIDTNSRLCMASAVAGHKRAFGSDTVPGTYEDLELADLVVLVGSNLAWCHPVLHQRLMSAKVSRPALTIVTIDPRQTATSDTSDIHLPVRPGADIALFNGLLAYLAEADKLDKQFIAEHTDGFGKAVKIAWQSTFSEISRLTGIPADALTDFYARFASTEKVVTVFSQGVNQSTFGTDKVNAIINVHLATGRIGRPGMGPFSITGQPNAMGGREVGGMANQLAAHGELDNAQDRQIIQQFWQSPNIASRPGLKAVDLFDAVADGRIKALLIAGTNPVDSMPDADKIRAALQDCPFVAVIDVVSKTDTTAYADVLFPAAAWGEKSGTVTNSERRISRQRAFLALPGDVKADWQIFAELARRMGYRGFEYGGPSEIFREHARLSEAVNQGRRDFNLGGLTDIDDEAYAALKPVQWPVSRETVAETRFFGDGAAFTPTGRLRFIATKIPPPLRSDRLFTLNTGRIRDQWHTMTRTGKSVRLSGHIAEPFAEINASEANELGIDAAGLVEISSVYGKVVVRAMPTDRQQAGSVFLPIHWTDQQSVGGRIGSLVAPDVDPHSGQPGLKATRVRIRAFPAGCFGFAVIAERPSLDGLDYAALAPITGGFRIEFAAASMPAEPEVLARHILNVDESEQLISVIDRKGQSFRFVHICKDRVRGAVWLGSEPVKVSRAYAVGQFDNDGKISPQLDHLIAGRAAGIGTDTGAIICNCSNVGIKTIEAAVASGQCRDVDSITRLLGAGGNCGSCRSDIRRIVSAKMLVSDEA